MEERLGLLWRERDIAALECVPVEIPERLGATEDILAALGLHVVTVADRRVILILYGLLPVLIED